MYREYKETLNGRIVYEQILPEDSERDPYYIQWVPSKTGKFEWVVGQGYAKWCGEFIAKYKFILAGKKIYHNQFLRIFPKKKICGKKSIFVS